MKNKFKMGNIITAKVTGIEKYGIFVKTSNDYNGLIHISEISHKFVGDVNNYAKIGDAIKVEIIGIEKDKKKLMLSMKNIKIKTTGPNEKGSGFGVLKNKLNEWIDNYK